MGNRPPKLKFWLEKTAETEHDNCVIWPGHVCANGYGKYGAFDGRMRYVHAIVCEIAHGTAPSTKHKVAHSCHNRACCNPQHLRWDTLKNNMADKKANGTYIVGSMHKLAKLTENDVTEIISDPRRYKAIASEYGVSTGVITSIKSGRSWPHLDRSSLARSPKYRPAFKGEEVPSAKLTEKQALQILADKRSSPIVAKEFGVSRTTIKDIRRGKTWKHLPR